MEDTVKTNSSGYANGTSLWLHAGEQADIAALNYLSHRLLQMDSGAIIVITSSFQNGGNLFAASIRSRYPLIRLISTPLSSAAIR